jgi:hypothetical protein
MTCPHRQPADVAALSAAAGVGRRGNSGATAGSRIRGSELRFLGGSEMPAFEVIDAGRIYPDADPTAQVREQLQRVIRDAEASGLLVFVAPGNDGIKVIRKPERS